MSFTERAADYTGKAGSWGNSNFTVYTTEAARMASAAARMMMAFNDGMRTLERVRNGGKQTVVVQRIEVKDNAQAVVAGSVVRKGRKGGGDGRL